MTDREIVAFALQVFDIEWKVLLDNIGRVCGFSAPEGLMWVDGKGVVKWSIVFGTDGSALGYQVSEEGTFRHI